MDKNTSYKIKLFTILVIGIIAVGLSSYYKDTPVVTISKLNYENQSHTIDSLQNVISSLEVEIESQAQRTDSKEKKYKEILSEYELGIDRIKKYYPNVYEDFHRILAHKEDYSREGEIENKKRLYEYDR